MLTTNSGDKFEGVFAGFSGATNASKIALKMTKKVPHTPITQPNGISSWEAAFAGSSPDHAMTFDLKDMADMTIPEYSLPELSRQTNGMALSLFLRHHTNKTQAPQLLFRQMPTYLATRIEANAFFRNGSLKPMTRPISPSSLVVLQAGISSLPIRR